jgi:hypothetical protein
MVFGHHIHFLDVERGEAAPAQRGHFQVQQHRAWAIPFQEEPTEGFIDDPQNLNRATGDGFCRDCACGR